MESIAVYVHFPFCISICPYCDFDRQATGFDRIDVYLEQVTRELRTYAGEARQVHSVFFGGGTPSLMRPGQTGDLLQAIRGTFALTSDAEITLEANPGDADEMKFGQFRSAGINRVSLGVQSLDDKFLQLLGRRHSVATARQAATWARGAGLHLNLDFMYGLPGQPSDHYLRTLDAALELEPDHLSCYALTLDGTVPMGRDVERGRLILPDDDLVAEMYEAGRQLLAGAGFEQYEISNWARPGQASRHNLTYWRDGTWIGVGAGAASSYGGRRWKNTPSLERYIRGMQLNGSADHVEEETPDAATRVLDFLTLGLRLREGLSLERLQARSGAAWAEITGQEGANLLERGILRQRGDRMSIDAAYQLMTNEVLARLAGPIHDWAKRQPMVA